MGLPRKNGKSTIGAALAIYLLVADGEPGAEVYSCAGDRKQAAIVFEEAKRMVLAEPELLDIIKPFKYHLEGPDNSIYRVLSADADLQQGLNPSGVIFDEVHVQPNGDLWDAMTMGTGTREQPIVIGITTAGFDRTSLCWNLYERGKRGEFAFKWYEPADSQCDHTDPAIWAEANPAFGDFLFPEALAEDVRGPESSFRRFHLNQWTTTHSAWFGHGVWEAAKDAKRPFDPEAPFVVFLDGSWSNDSTGLVACSVNDPHLSVLGHWTPDADLGHIELGQVERRLREVMAMPGFTELAFDSARFIDFYSRFEFGGSASHRLANQQPRPDGSCDAGIPRGRIGPATDPRR